MFGARGAVLIFLGACTLGSVDGVYRVTYGGSSCLESFTYQDVTYTGCTTAVFGFEW
jgi:hypothetical protein